MQNSITEITQKLTNETLAREASVGKNSGATDTRLDALSASIQNEPLARNQAILAIDTKYANETKNLEERLDEQKSTLQTLGSTIIRLDKELIEYRQIVATLNGFIDSKAQDMEQAYSDLSEEFNANLSRIIKDMEVLKTDTSGLKTDTSKLKSDAENLKWGVTRLNTKVYGPIADGDPASPSGSKRPRSAKSDDNTPSFNLVSPEEIARVLQTHPAFQALNDRVQELEKEREDLGAAAPTTARQEGDGPTTDAAADVNRRLQRLEQILVLTNRTDVFTDVEDEMRQQEETMNGRFGA